MLISSVDRKGEFYAGFATNSADAQMVSRMRMVLAVSVLLAVFVDPSSLSSLNGFTWLVFFGYLFHSIVIYIYSLRDKPFSQSILIHRLDVLWFALIVIFTGGVDSFFFLFFFFAIITSSLRWGFEEGAKVTMASVILFAALGLALETQSDFSRLLLRTTFLLTIGYMSVYWGESKVRLMHQLALLRDVSRLSNPRFGVDHTITSVLEQTRQFFKASSCILVMQDKESGAYSLRTIKDGNTTLLISADSVSAEAALPLMAVAQDHLIAYARPLWPLMASLFQESLAYDCSAHRWEKQEGPSSKNLAELLEARSFISAPLSLRRQQGRIYVLSPNESFNKADALFLSHITVQAFPVIENIELLDRMASEAALQERHKISLDLHDTAIQPYIGLKLGLGAVRNKASFDNPLIEDIDKLTMMAEKVINDLRRFAVNFKNGPGQTEPVLLVVLNQQAAQVRELYGIDIGITMAGELKLSDRLATEVLQLVREGLSNICKHTLAQKGFVKIQCSNESLKIQIENEYKGLQPIAFMPRSMSERAAGLGGTLRVNQGPGGSTVVNVEIPV
ncbi:Histidine kinase [Polaromonas sp. OV174]|uniref:sensor histidine kinase n=1 Tax=Polaromonas sp. OV174 TaxID=1855300 RepID=UPI0008ED3944|nr:histidine kinase [Polaromonas sp. OV174]SFC26829.1 Histidine kinase [Polaromonas sp. OV174]